MSNSSTVLEKTISIINGKKRTAGYREEDLRFVEICRKVNKHLRNIGASDILDLAEVLMGLNCLDGKKNPDGKISYEDIRKITRESKLEYFRDDDFCTVIWELIKGPSLVDTSEEDIRNKKTLRQFLRIPYDYDENNKDVKEIEEKGCLESLKRFHTYLKRELFETEEQRRIFSKLLLADKTGVLRIFTFLGTINSLEENERKIYPTIELAKGETLSLIAAIPHFIKTYEEIEIKYKKKANKIESALRSLTSRFDYDGIISLSEQELEKIDDEDIVIRLLREVIEHNTPYYERISFNLRQDEKKSKTELLFRGSSFSWDSLTKEQQDRLAKDGNDDNIKQILGILTRMNIVHYNSNFPIVEVLLLSRPSIVNEINKLVENKIISIEYVSQNPEIFIEGHDKVLKENIIRLKGQKIDTRIVSKSSESEILLHNPSDIQQVLKLVSAYGLQYGSSNRFNLFINPKLIEVVDRFIEIGWGDFIRKNPKYISEEAMTYAKRIQICGLTKNELNGNDTLPPVIISEQFVLAGNYISDDDLDKIIPNAYGLYADAVAFKALSEKKEVAVSPERIPELKEYEQDYSYNIEDIIISKPKVARCLAVIEQSNLCNGLSREQKIFNAMIYGSSLDEEQLKVISNIFGDKIQKTREI